MNEAVKIQLIHSPSGEAMVVIPLAEYETLLAATQPDDDALDVAIYDARKRELADQDHAIMPSAVSMALLRGEHRVTALRKWRGLTQKDVSQRAGIAQGYLSDIERGRRTGSPDTITQLATVLNVPEAWLV